MSNVPHNIDLFSSLISDIKSYSGKDPLLPWLKGIRSMKECLSPQLLNEKLPRFLQKCAQTFESDRVYRNDLRFLRVWLQLMDFVDDPKVLLKSMERNQIGTKRSLFYQAYALYYEKLKKFEDAEKMYHLGVQNFAEPLDDLQKSYEQFLHRMERHKTKKIQRQERKSSSRHLSVRSTPLQSSENKENNENIGRHSGSMLKQKESTSLESDDPNIFLGDDKSVAKFVDTAIVDNSAIEDACHHGLVDPTINLKEAMNDINNMFREPIESSLVGKRSQKNRLIEDRSLNGGIKVFVDDGLGDGVESSHQREIKKFSKPAKSHQESFQIYVDGEEDGDDENNEDEEDNMQEPQAFVFPSPNDFSSESSNERDVEKSSRPKFREDTVVCRFVGSTIMDEGEVENACHHGLVDPTVNLKEAMADINNMFGKPMEFVRANRQKRQEKGLEKKTNHGEFSILPDDNVKPYQKDKSCGFSIFLDDDLKAHQKEESCSFSILPDDDIEPQKGSLVSKSSSKSSERDMFEPTMFTKEAIDEINKMFGMPMDF